MNAYVKILSPKMVGRFMDFDDVQSALKHNGIYEELHEEAIKKALRDRLFNTLIHAAQGIEPQHGKDAYLDTKLEIREKINFEEFADKDQIDWRELNLITNVMAGEVLVEKIPAQKGVHGRDLLGNPIQARDGLDIILEGGENTVLANEGHLLKAAVNGHVVKKKGVISVYSVYTVHGDVGPKTGNITNMGSVEIQGNVLDGYNVKAAGNISIQKSVGACQIEATGDVVVKRGVSGKGKAKIVSKHGSCYARFIQDTHVTVAHDLFVHESLMHCYIKAGRCVELTGKKAAIVGGKIRSLKEISAKIMGSKAQVQTELEVGVSPDIRENFEALTSRLQEIEPRMVSLKLDITTLEKTKLDEEKEMKLTQLKEALNELLDEQKDKQEEVFNLEEAIKNSPVQGKNQRDEESLSRCEHEMQHGNFSP